MIHRAKIKEHLAIIIVIENNEKLQKEDILFIQIESLAISIKR
jgi:hypothetical protein